MQTTALERRALAPLAALAFCAVPATAQFGNCGQPDNLDQGQCWDLIDLSIPQFPQLSIDGSALCFDSCAPVSQSCTKIVVQPPQQVVCGEYSAQLDVVDCATGVTLLQGKMLLDYTRTWIEDDAAAGTAYQVWRFTAKADMFLANPGVIGPSCIVPPVLTQYPSAFYYGYLDYALDCGTGGMTGAMVLMNNCDAFINMPVFSSTPSTLSPTRKHVLVMPDNAAMPFVPSIATAPGGALAGEAVRNVQNAFGVPFCSAEERLAGGVLQTIGSACFCPLSFFSPQVTASRMLGDGTCPDPATGQPSQFQTLNFYPTLPWYDLMSFSIGRWAGAAGYPSQEHVWLNEGLFRYVDSCTAVAGAVPTTSIEVFYGATTRGGHPVQPVQASQQLSDVFIDLASNFSFVLGSGPFTPPMVGSVIDTKHLIYTNVF